MFAVRSGARGRAALRGALALALLPVAAAGAGCENDPTEFLMTFDACEPLVLEPGESFGAAEVAAVQDTIDLWREVSPVRLTLEPTAGAATLPVLGTDSEAFFGQFDDRRGVILLSRHMTDRRQRAIVLAHEVGHAYGLFHAGEEDRPSVMTSGNRDVPPTAGDAAGIEALWGDCSGQYSSSTTAMTSRGGTR